MRSGPPSPKGEAVVGREPDGAEGPAQREHAEQQRQGSGGLQERDPDQARRRREDRGEHDGADPEAANERRGGRFDQHVAEEQRGHRQPGLSRGPAETQLEEQREQERDRGDHGPEHRAGAGGDPIGVDPQDAQIHQRVLSTYASWRWIFLSTCTRVAVSIGRSCDVRQSIDRTDDWIGDGSHTIDADLDIVARLEVTRRRP
jgi:hypothetical protein